MHVVATAGHVDHGKSTLVLALTTMDPDRFEEEKRRGLTIDLGFAWTTLPSGEGIAFVDVPGHVRFLKNMLAGVGAVDACMFVVAATEAWKPQSEEHLRILELLGVTHGLIALTKVGVVDDDHREIARLDVADRITGTFLEHAEMVDVDAPAGIGLDALRAALDRLLAATPFAAYVGSGEHAVRVRVLGTDAIEPGGTGFVRLHLPVALPLVPGDRFVLREFGRDETVGGGEVLDVAPVLPAAKAQPSRSVDRVIAERGWMDADDLEALTGERRPPTLGRWVVAPEALAATRNRVLGAVEAAGPLGVDVATFDDH